MVCGLPRGARRRPMCSRDGLRAVSAPELEGPPVPSLLLLPAAALHRGRQEHSRQRGSEGTALGRLGTRHVPVRKRACASSVPASESRMQRHREQLAFSGRNDQEPWTPFPFAGGAVGAGGFYFFYFYFLLFAFIIYYFIFLLNFWGWHWLINQIGFKGTM